MLEFMQKYLEDGGDSVHNNVENNIDITETHDSEESITDIARTHKNIQGMIREALTFDLYYRENCKSRPSWAPDPGKFKHMTHEYCKNGKLSHIEPFHYVFPEKEKRKIADLPEYCEEPVWALFHYDRRDPLDNQAYVEYINKNKME